MTNVKLSQKICGVNFKNPLIMASGTYGYGREFSKYIDLNELGGICTKAVTLKARTGNAPPRVAEVACGMLNSVGLQNKGIEYFVEKELPFLYDFDTRIIANISGETKEEFVELAKILSKEKIDMIEVNVSCPNVKNEGMSFGIDEKSVYDITYAVKEVSSKPVIIKLTPNVTNIVKIASAAKSGGADAVSLINTLLGMSININTRRPVLKNNVGGLSGPAVKPVAVRMVWQVSSAVDIPIIGMGGISTWEDAAEIMLAGASLVSVGTANFLYPGVPIEIRDGLREYMEKNNIEKIGDITGAVVPY